MNWYLAVLKQYAVFTGRARRKEYWMFALFNVIIAMVLVGVEMAATQGGTNGIIANIYSLAVLLPSIGVTARRLHDTGRSGWWMLLSLVPFGAFVVLVFVVQDSQPGENQYGPNPKMAAAF